MASANYDVFISAKSEDNHHAAAVCDFLQGKGLNVFWSERSLPKLAQANYRRAIDDALDASMHCVVVASSADNVRSEWVEAEWGSFINEQRSGRKKGNLVTVLCGAMRIAELPMSLRQYQAVSLPDLKAVLSFVGKGMSEKSPQAGSPDIMRESADQTGEVRTDREKPSISDAEAALRPPPVSVLPDVAVLFARELNTVSSNAVRSLESRGFKVWTLEDSIQPSGHQEDRTFRRMRDPFVVLALAGAVFGSGEPRRSSLCREALRVAVEREQQKGKHRYLIVIVNCDTEPHTKILGLPKELRDRGIFNCPFALLTEEVKNLVSFTVSNNKGSMSP